MLRQKSILLGLAITLLFASSNGFAERPDISDLTGGRCPDGNIYCWLMNMGNIAFTKNSTGAPYLPVAVLQGMNQGRFSPFSQLLLVTHTMSQCARNSLKAKYTPGRRTAYVEAADMFEKGLCRMTNCFQQSFSTIMMMETNRQLEESGMAEEDKKNFKQDLALAMYQTFNQTADRCGGDGGGVDSLLFQILGGLSPK